MNLIPDDFLRILPRLDFVEASDGTLCWLWKGARRGGERRSHSGPRYGCIRIRRELLYVHRVVYVLFKGEIPDGADVDHSHLCGLGHCVNPRYLDAVDKNTNLRRAAALTNVGDRYAYEQEEEWTL